MSEPLVTDTVKHVGFSHTLWHLLPLVLGIFGISRHRQATPQVQEHPSRMAGPLPFIGRARGDAYLERLNHAWSGVDWVAIEQLAQALLAAWRDGHQVFICGNGGSAANAVHLANDLLYGIDKPVGRGMRVVALPSNTAVLTCLGNDTSYAEIYSKQLDALAGAGDLLIVFSGSGNSPNILEALRTARRIGVQSHAILGYKGGESLKLADNPIHFSVEDMQVSEDLQMMVGHMICQWLLEQRHFAGR